MIYAGTSLLGGDKKKFIERSDRLTYAIFPSAAYGLLVLGGVLSLFAPRRGLTLVAGGMLSLLVVAIRNSWSIAIDVASSSPEPAEFLRRTATMGSIEVGKNADIVLLDGNPVENVQNLHGISGVVRAGFYYSHTDLSALRDRANESPKAREP